jgi:aryl-alcohol dehydrogenase-like predicted oxidoreductase
MREKNDFSASKNALDNSLQRLQTDYLDLYQLHWRKTNFFGQRGFKVQEDGWEDNIHAVLDTLGDFIKKED